MIRPKSKQKAFTLIELLIVIAIIGMLASIILVALNKARSKARDAVRISDAKEIQTALEMYYNNNGQYPASVPGGSGCWWNWEAGNTINGTSIQFLQPLITDGDMQKVPMETFWNPGTSGGSGWIDCTYRYATGADFSSTCGSGWNNVAAFYMVLENPRPVGSDGQAPSCVSSAGWGEGGPSDPNGYLILFPG